MISSTCARTASSEMPRRLERLGRDALALVDQAEQDVLGPDVVVVEEARLFLREDHDPSCSVGEALEQDDPPLVRLPAAAGCAPFYRPVRRTSLATGDPVVSIDSVRHLGRRILDYAGSTPESADRRRPSLGTWPNDAPTGAVLASPEPSLRSRPRAAPEAPDAEARPPLTSHLLDEVGLAPLPGDLERVEVRLRDAVSADDRFLGEVAGHLLAAGGKRLRPTLTLCAAYAAVRRRAGSPPTTRSPAAPRSSSCTSGRCTTTT